MMRQVMIWLMVGVLYLPYGLAQEKREAERQRTTERESRARDKQGTATQDSFPFTITISPEKNSPLQMRKDEKPIFDSKGLPVGYYRMILDSTGRNMVKKMAVNIGQSEFITDIGNVMLSGDDRNVIIYGSESYGHLASDLLIEVRTVDGRLMKERSNVVGDKYVIVTSTDGAVVYAGTSGESRVIEIGKIDGNGQTTWKISIPYCIPTSLSISPESSKIMINGVFRDPKNSIIKHNEVFLLNQNGTIESKYAFPHGYPWFSHMRLLEDRYIFASNGDVWYIFDSEDSYHLIASGTFSCQLQQADHIDINASKGIMIFALRCYKENINSYVVKILDYMTGKESSVDPAIMLNGNVLGIAGISDSRRRIYLSDKSYIIEIK